MRLTITETEETIDVVVPKDGPFPEMTISIENGCGSLTVTVNGSTVYSVLWDQLKHRSVQR